MFNTNNLGGWIIPAGTEIAAETGIPRYSEIGNRCTIGDCCKIGYGCTWLGVKVKSWLTLANVDGTGRQIKVIRGGENEVKIEAGCFIGNLDEFIAKAKSEGKLRYVAVIGAIAEHV